MGNFYKPSDYLKMDPLSLAEILRQEVVISIPENVETIENNKKAAEAITKATAFATFFTEMETVAKLMKRSAKSNKDKDEFERLIGVEEVFKSFKEISKMQIENVAKIMTLRRLDLDEQKNQNRT